jgi:hypothetical protein
MIRVRRPKVGRTAMTERRRAGSLIMLVVAGLAVAGTSATTPPPGPTQPLSSSGSLRLSADQPVAIQPLVFVVEQGNLNSLALTPTIVDAPDDGSIVASIVRVDEAQVAGSDPATGSASGPPTSTWSIGCPTNPCTARYALVVTWFNAPAKAEAELRWTVDATATFSGSVPAGATPGRVTLSAPSDDGAPPRAELTRPTSGKAVRLTEADRFRSWTITLRRSDPGQATHGWPAVAQARLSLTTSQVAGPSFVFGQDGQPEDSRVRTRTDPPVQLRLATSAQRTMTAWAADRPIEFDPFARCAAEGPCETTLTVELAWADGRPETAFDAAWTIDLASINATEPAAPIETTVEAIVPLHMATATTSGSFEEPGPFSQPAVEFDVVAPKLPDLENVQAAPARALVTVSVTSVGSVPLPADAVISIFADGRGSGIGTGVFLSPGETASFAWEPRGLCSTGISATCSANGSLGAVIYQPNRNTAKVEGMVARIDWTIEAGVGTVDGGTAVINLEPQPTKRP